MKSSRTQNLYPPWRKKHSFRQGGRGKELRKIKELIYVAESESEIRGMNRLKEKLEELLTKIQRYEQDEEESIKKLNISQNSTIWEYSILMGSAMNSWFRFNTSGNLFYIIAIVLSFKIKFMPLFAQTYISYGLIAINFWSFKIFKHISRGYDYLSILTSLSFFINFHISHYYLFFPINKFNLVFLFSQTINTKNVFIENLLSLDTKSL